MHPSTKDKSILVVSEWWLLCQNHRSIAYLRNVCAPKCIIIFLLRVANHCRQTDRLLGIEANLQLTHRRAPHKFFCSAFWASLGLMNTTPPLSLVRSTYFWMMPSPQYPLPWVYTAAGDGSPSSLPEMVMTRYWYTLPRLRSLENAQMTMSSTDTVWGGGQTTLTPLHIF